MRRILLLISFFIGGLSFAHAQDDAEPGKKAEQIQALYVAYITQQLNLTPQEAEKFWPLHKQFDSEIKGVDLSLPELTRQQRILDIKKNYQDRFTKILGNNGRTDNFFRLDNEFRRKMVERLRNLRQQNNRNNQRPFKRGNR